MRRTALWLALLVTMLIGTVAGVAFLQYRWLGDLSAAEQQRLRGEMTFGVRQIAEEVDREINRIPVNFQNSGGAAEEVALRAKEWRSNARDTRLVKAFYIVHPRAGGLVVGKLDVDKGTLDDLPSWPSDLEPIRQVTGPPVPGQHRGPVVSAVPAFIMPLRPAPPPAEAQMPRLRRDAPGYLQLDQLPPRARQRIEAFQRGEPPPGPPPEEGPIGFLQEQAPGPPGVRPPPPPAVPPPSGRLYRRPQAAEPAAEPPPGARPGAGGGILIAQLDRDYILRVMIPQLARRSLTTDYDLFVSRGSEILTRSDPSWPRLATDAGEAGANFVSLRPRIDGGDVPWRIVVRRHSGALADLVERARRRNLAVGALVLLLLVASIVLLAVLARRADRMRVQQLEFVAGITHELNTPIAALRSAGQNLADGIVHDGAQVTRYGAMIAKEAKRLSETVAQVLDYAGLQSRSAIRREPVDVGWMVGEAIAQCRWIAEEHGVTIEEKLPRELPAVEGDPLALIRAIQNLVANAIRHGAAGKWVGVSAANERERVVIRIEDRGPGIGARDARRLFEPFYRGRHSSRVRGSGLGLSIVRKIALAHGGNVTLERSGPGALFALSLPASPAASRAAEVQHA
jgi:signal transduction histidine kinase